MNSTFLMSIDDATWWFDNLAIVPTLEFRQLGATEGVICELIDVF
jgi:hypothetical protein